MQARKKRRSSGSSGSASDMDPPPNPEDTNERSRKPAAKGGKDRGGRTKGQQPSKKSMAEGACACEWLGALEADIFSACVRGSLCAFV